MWLLLLGPDVRGPASIKRDVNEDRNGSGNKSKCKGPTQDRRKWSGCSCAGGHGGHGRAARLSGPQRLSVSFSTFNAPSSPPQTQWQVGVARVYQETPTPATARKDVTVKLVRPMQLVVVALDRQAAIRAEDGRQNRSKNFRAT